MIGRQRHVTEIDYQKDVKKKKLLISFEIDFLWYSKQGEWEYATAHKAQTVNERERAVALTDKDVIRSAISAPALCLCSKVNPFLILLMDGLIPIFFHTNHLWDPGFQMDQELAC